VGGLPTNRTVNGFAVHPENSRVMMYAAMRDGLFRSVDAGESWKPVGKDLKNIAAAAVNPRRPEEAYATAGTARFTAAPWREHMDGGPLSVTGLGRREFLARTALAGVGALAAPGLASVYCAHPGAPANRSSSSMTGTSGRPRGR